MLKREPKSPRPLTQEIVRRTDPKPDLRARILTAARSLFAERGFFSTNTREIARIAGTSESGIYRVFHGTSGGKYELLMAVYNDCWREVNERLDARLEESEDRDPRNTLHEILRLQWQLYDENPLLASFLIINTGNTDTLLVEHKQHAIISEENLRYVARIEDLCSQCVDRSLVDRRYTSRSLCEGLLGVSEGVLLGWYLADKTADHTYPAKISIEQALVLVENLLWCDGAVRHPVITRRSRTRKSAMRS